MKKPIKKLSLNKKTISNLNAAEMNRQAGGDKTNGHTCPRFTVLLYMYMYEVRRSLLVLRLHLFCLSFPAGLLY